MLLGCPTPTLEPQGTGGVHMWIPRRLRVVLAAGQLDGLFSLLQGLRQAEIEIVQVGRGGQGADLQRYIVFAASDSLPIGKPVRVKGIQ